MNFYQFIIPRLNGNEIEKNFDYYLRLVKKGIAGFIIFGGRLETVRQGISKLQKGAAEPLIIASDLEQGLGQQLEGGTVFPPAMAIASAIKIPTHPSPSKGEGKGGGIAVSLRPMGSQQFKLLKKALKAIAIEAKYAGINTIFAPVLDINTNPLNPIISTRAFGEDPETVSFFGCEMIRILQDNGIASCGKHFPGHGDTETDSHISLPLIKKELQLLEKTELVPFRKAIKTGVKMIMLGHLSVPAIDPSGIPASISEKAIRYLRDKMGFNGITITDALNMGGLAQITKATKNVKSLHSPFTKRGRGGIFEIASPEPALSDKTRFFARLRRAQNDRIVIEEEASLMALRAGVDLLLHPTDPDRVASYLEKTNYYPASSTINRLEVFRRTHCCLAEPVKPHPFFERHKKLSEELARKAINIKGEMKPMKKPFLILLNDDEAEKGGILINVLKSRYPNLRYISFCSQMPVIGSQFRDKIGSQIIVAVFSRIKAWKGETAPWLKRAIKELEERAKIFVSFGSPYLFDGIKNDITKIYAYWDSETVQKAVAELICLLSNPPLPPFSKGG